MDIEDVIYESMLRKENANYIIKNYDYLDVFISKEEEL